MPKLDSPSSSGNRAGIVQIARRLGVSPSTVSRALRSETAHMVEPERRKAILDLADALHFTPNVGARMLRSGVGKTLTVVVPHDENIFFSEYYGRFLAAVLRAAAARDWDVHISTLRHTPGQDTRQTLQTIGLETSGTIYIGEPLTREELVHLRAYRRTLVMMRSSLPVDIDLAEVGHHVIGVDNYSGARAAAGLLKKMGHSKIGIVIGPSTSRDAFERRKGYLEELNKGGAVTVRPEWIIEGGFTHDNGREAFGKLFAGSKRPTAVCCASDEIAFGLIDAARAAGVRCPEDLSVVGFDDGPWALACRPTLTTVRQPLSDLAELAVGLVVEGAASKGAARRAVCKEMPAALVIRESAVSL